MTGKALTVAPVTAVALATDVNALLAAPLITAGGKRLRRLVVEFFGVSIRNDNTRKAYLKACASLCDFLDELNDAGGSEDLPVVHSLLDVEATHVAAWLESLKADARSVATQKQYLAAVRMLFDYVVSRGGGMPFNPALSVKAERQSITKGKTPTLTADECGTLLRSIPTDDLVGLRDRALIGVMVFTFARVSAAVGLTVGGVFRQKKRLWLRLHEKGGKVHDMPCHHTLEEYLAEFIDAAELSDAPGSTPLFQSFKRRPYGRGEPELSGRGLSRVEAWQMVQRRAAAAELDTHICNHTFRGTGITTYLENGGTLENAQKMAAHASTRTTQLYDRRRDDVTLDEVVKINIKG